MCFNTIKKRSYKCILISLFILYPLFLLGADENKYKYESQMSVLKFYLIRLYDIEKCEATKNFYSKKYNWCLREFPKVNKSNIELHFIINENSSLTANLIKSSTAEMKKLKLKNINNFINDYPHFIGFYSDPNNNQERIEEDLVELMDLYLHYCVGDKCYIKKHKINL